jgi:hypothetical protein
MSLCAVNGLEFNALEGFTTWGQLLDMLEQGVGPERPVVTAVRFGGVDQPSFREPMLLDQALEAVAPIDVDTCRADCYLAEAVESALTDLAPLLEATQVTADAFRSHDIADANNRLAVVLATFQALTQLTAAVAESTLVPRSVRGDSGCTAMLARAGQHLESLVTAASNEDWISVADILEYDITDLLPDWQAVLRVMASPGESRM